MYQGLLEAKGFIQLDQFWPLGKSDADTVKVDLVEGNNAFRFRPRAGAAFQTTRVFYNAKVRGRSQNDAVKKGRITVRLQGVDAPELHFQPQYVGRARDIPESKRIVFRDWNENYRQYMGETATVKLYEKLKKGGKDPLPCKVVTAVDEPDEVFDTYGRFVGNVIVKINNKDVDINEWLVRNGWGFPAFYNSMSEDEIEELIRASDSAYYNSRGIWAETNMVAEKVGSLDWDCIERKQEGEVKLKPDQEKNPKPIVVPKLFRRLATWAVNKKAKIVSGSFKEYLDSKDDQCMWTDDFIDQGEASYVYQLADFVQPNGYMDFWPENLVFREATSRLVYASSGNPVTHW